MSLLERIRKWLKCKKIDCGEDRYFVCFYTMVREMEECEKMFKPLRKLRIISRERYMKYLEACLGLGEYTRKKCLDLFNQCCGPPKDGEEEEW